MSAPQRTGLLDRGWEETQIKVFTRWCQKYLSQQKIEFNDIRTDFRDGVKLLQLLQIIGKDPLPGKWHQVVKNRYHQLENVQLAIKYITEVKEIKLVGIHPEEIVDGNLKITLGLAWSCINKFQIEDISVEEKTARDALLIWCQKNTRDYDISITNFTTSWSSGLLFCALINHFRPNELDYDALNKDDHMANVTAAFDACRRIGLTVFLDPEDLVGCVPDDKSVVTQVSEFFHFFASESKITAMADKIKSTLKNQKQIDEMSNLYEQQAQAALDAMAKEKESIESDEYERTVPGVRAKLGDVIKYAHTARPQIIELRGTALRTWASIVTKCKPISRKVPVPPEGKEPETLNAKFEELENVQAKRRAELQEILKQIEKEKVDSFDQMCQEILNKVDEINQRSNSLEGTIEEQHDVINGLIAEAEEKQSHLPELQPPYNELIQLNLNNRSKFTPYAIQKEVDQLIVHLKHLLDQNKAAALQADNERRIREYNDKAQKYIDVAQDIEKELDSIEGSLPERRAAFIKQQSEIAEKREKVNEIDPDFEDLEKDGLHLGISNTPEYIKTQYGNSLKRAITETNKIFDEMVNEYDALAGKITERVRDLTNQAEAVKQPEKVLETQKAEYEELQGKAAEVEAELPTLDHPYSEIVEFKLAARIKTTPSEAASQVAQLKNLLDKLLEDNAAAIVKRENERRIKEYNELAQTYVDKSRDFAATVDAIDGTLVERRTAYLQKQKELNEKRDDLDNLTPHYQALEKDGLHMNINNTPISISSFYAQVLEKITNALNLIYDEMVKNFDEMATALNERIKKVEAEHKAIDGTLQEKKEKLAAELTEAQGIHDDVPQLNEPFAELTEFKLNYRPKFTPIDIQGYIDQLIANINHVNQINDSEIQAESNKARIDNYIGKAQAVVDEAKELEASINEIDGTNEEKLEKLYAKDKEVNEKQKKIDEITPIYQDLEKDDLHLNIENTPSSILAFFDNMHAHIHNLIQEVDKAIATAKGLEISEEQLQEFRDTFSFFDKDNTKSLEPYELKACLTALGENVEDEECNEIIKKYTGGNTSMDFDNYVKFMLDRFTKQETAETTKDAFKAVTKNAPVMTEELMNQHFTPEDVEYMKANMPQTEDGYDYSQWADSVFVE